MEQNGEPSGPGESNARGVISDAGADLTQNSSRKRRQSRLATMTVKTGAITIRGTR